MPESMDVAQDRTPEQIEQEEAERAARENEIYGPYREAAQRRNNSATSVAEHDDMIAEILYEVTMLAFGEEVL